MNNREIIFRICVHKVSKNVHKGKFHVHFFFIIGEHIQIEEGFYHLPDATTTI